uniref:Uncharacterized protein n=1 Tax=viral metagenome TaxID=1070528 RepID=A0A6C0EQ70_9ZZZZ
MSSLIYNTIFEIISATSSLVVLISMIYFAKNITNSIEIKMVNLKIENLDLEVRNKNLTNKLNTYKDEYESREKTINKLLEEKLKLEMNIAKCQLYTDYVCSLEKENQEMLLKLQTYENKFQKERDLRLKEDRRRKNILLQESFPILSYDEY